MVIAANKIEAFMQATGSSEMFALRALQARAIIGQQARRGRATQSSNWMK